MTKIENAAPHGQDQKLPQSVSNPRDLVVRLVQWAEQMGCLDAPVWQDAAAFVSAQQALKSSQVAEEQGVTDVAVHAAWEYGGEESSASMAPTHVIKIDDRRKAHGRVHVAFSGMEAQTTDRMEVVLDIDQNPYDLDIYEGRSELNVPAVHVAMDGQSATFTLFKLGGRILLQPIGQVPMREVQVVNPLGSFQTAYLVG